MSMILIQRQVLSSSAASVTFSNVPQNYRTLVLLVSARTSTSSGVNPVEQLNISFNGSSTNLSRRVLLGNGSTVASFSANDGEVGQVNTSLAPANTFSNIGVVIPNYAGTSNKAYSYDAVGENNATLSSQMLGAGLWSNASPVTSIGLAPASNQFVANSSFSLYGLSA